MFELLVTVALDAFEKSTQRLLLPLPEQCFLLFNELLQLVIGCISFVSLHLFRLQEEDLGLFVPLRESQLTHLIFELHQLSRVLDLVTVFSSQLLM